MTTYTNKQNIEQHRAEMQKIFDGPRTKAEDQALFDDLIGKGSAPRDWSPSTVESMYGLCQIYAMGYRAASKREASTEPSAEIDERHEFERVMSQRGDAANYIGDGMYSTGAVQDQWEIWLARSELAAAGGAQKDEAKDAALRDALNTTLWLYRRLPHAYRKPPFVDAAILTMAKYLGMDDAPEAIKERTALIANTKAKEGE